MKTACTTDIRMAIVEALECRVAGTAHELATDTGLDAGLVVQLLIEAAVVGTVRRACMTRTDHGLEVVWAHGGQR